MTPREDIEIIGDVERVDRAFEQAEADRIREKWETGQAGRDATRAKQRRDEPLGLRLYRVMTVAARLSGGAVRSISQEGSTPARESQAPPNADTVDLDRHLRVVRRRIEDMERELDAYLGVTKPEETALLSNQQKDRIICSRRYEGWRPEDVHDAQPELGSARTIRRIRSVNGLRGVDGRPKDQAQAA